MQLFLSFFTYWIFSFAFVVTCYARPDLWQRGSAARNASGFNSTSKHQPLRNIYAVSDIALQPVAISPKSGKELLFGHVSSSESPYSKPSSSNGLLQSLSWHLQVLTRFRVQQAFLHVEGTASDGALRIEHVQPSPSTVGLRVLDYSVSNNNKTTLSSQAAPNTIRRIYSIGQTKLANTDFANPSTGKGLVLDVWVS